MKNFRTAMVAVAIAVSATQAGAQTDGDAPGQGPLAAELSAFAAALGATSLTARSHSIPSGGSIFNGEGQACPSNTRMISGACHPGYSDRMRIINQFPNVSGNHWRCGFRNTSGSQRTAWVYTLCAATAGPPQPPLVSHDLEVRRFTTTPLTNARSDQIMVDASDVIQTDSGANDIACNVELRRSGAVVTFATGDGSIDSAADFSAVNGLPGNVKVVNQINWCGSIGASIIGCAPVPGDSLVVVRFTESLEGILLLHEFGHNQGLGHRNGTDNVMHPSIGASRVGVNATECTAFRTSPAVSATVGGPPVVMASGAGQGAAGFSAEEVHAIIKQHYVHGFPVEVGVRLGSDELPVLEEILADPTQMEWWPNAVAAIGLSGADNAFEILRAFLEEPAEGTLPRAHYRAKATVPLAMGYYVNQTGDDEALDYMIQAVDPAFWQDREGVGRAEFQASMTQSEEDLSKNFMLGLALAVTEDGRALEALKALQSGSRKVAGALAERSDDLLEQLVQEYNKVAEQGLQDYDASRHSE